MPSLTACPVTPHPPPPIPLKPSQPFNQVHILAELPASLSLQYLDANATALSPSTVDAWQGSRSALAVLDGSVYTQAGRVALEGTQSKTKKHAWSVRRSFPLPPACALV